MRAALAAAGAVAAGVGLLQLHGTGTPLGDPIEAGAAAAVLLTANRSPLTIAASKTWVGHAEPAAGVASLALAARQAAHSASSALLHLRAVNAYVASALGQAGGSVTLPRQALGVSRPGAIGTSAFAFQGAAALLTRDLYASSMGRHWLGQRIL
jgi:acyl transferase domain-containing protein